MSQLPLNDAVKMEQESKLVKDLISTQAKELEEAIRSGKGTEGRKTDFR